MPSPQYAVRPEEDTEEEEKVLPREDEFPPELLADEEAPERAEDEEPTEEDERAEENAELLVRCDDDDPRDVEDVDPAEDEEEKLTEEEEVPPIQMKQFGGLRKSATHSCGGSKDPHASSPPNAHSRPEQKYPNEEDENDDDPVPVLEIALEEPAPKEEVLLLKEDCDDDPPDMLDCELPPLPLELEEEDELTEDPGLEDPPIGGGGTGAGAGAGEAFALVP
jgi:hypothetical protein